MTFLRLLDRFYYSELYLDHSGFGDGFLLVTLLDRSNPDPGSRSALFEGAAAQGPFRKIHAGRNVLVVQLPTAGEATRPVPTSDSDEEDLGPLVMLAFDHHHLPRRHRVDLFVAAGHDPVHVHVRLTASRKPSGEHAETLFEGLVPVTTDPDPEPFLMHAPGA